jgi:aldose 1-epimerase
MVREASYFLLLAYESRRPWSNSSIFHLDNCYIVTRDEEDLLNWRENDYVLRLHSAWSGIRLDVYSDQEAVQLYSCNFQDGTTPLKKTQGLIDEPDFPRTIPKYGCVVVEVQEWIDGINHPEWERKEKQFFEPGGRPYVLQGSYRFRVDESG